MKIATAALLFSVSAATAALDQPNVPQVLDLATSEWTLSSRPPNISVPGSVPSHVHLDLLQAGIIEDPFVKLCYYGMNDFELRWVAWGNWTYSTSLEELSRSKPTTTWLVFNGLDTFTDIKFCDKPIGSTNNQFRQFYFDVSSLLVECDQESPTLSVDFGSAPVIAEQIANEPGQETWPWGVIQLYEIHNRQFIRKEQNDFGWDWGPAFAPAGIWQPAYVVQIPGEEKKSAPVYIRNSVFDIYRMGQLNSLIPDQTAPWVLNASMDYLGSGPVPSDISLSYTIKDTKGAVVNQGDMSNISSTAYTVSGAVVLDSSLFDLWWPTGMGPQNLYDVTVDIVDSEGQTLASVDKRTGFRTIVLNQGEITTEQIGKGVAPGANWHFEINGHEFYAKGSNFIPPDVFWPRVTKDRMTKLFDSVIDGNQNMLRVWSSGAYTPDFIFDIADAMGILLWNEFEFGCALYPVDKPFLENVRDEAYYNVRRVNHHPSLALWAGGNELENLELPLAKEADPESYPKYLAEYETLFLDVLLHQVYDNTRSISYTPSSTSNGYLSLDHSRPNPIVQRYDNTTEGYYYGDTDHYNYNSREAFDFSTYPVGRFANEFGYHSMPSLQTWREAIPPEDLFFNSTTIVLGHMRHYPPGNLNTTNWHNASIGMAEMTLPVELYYPVPDKADPVANFSAWCWTTQIFQTEFYRSQIQFYRRGSGLGNRQLGSLYWQLEDQWPAPTWAGIEYNGRWKVLHYGAKDAYEPIIISPFYNKSTGDLSVWVTSDLWSPATGSVSFAWYDWSGNAIEGTDIPASKSFRVGGLNSTQVLHTNMKDLAALDPTNAVLYMNITAEGTRPNTPADNIITFIHENFFSPVHLSEAKIVDPGLTLSYSEESGNFTVTATKGISAWTWLDYDHEADTVAKTVGNFNSNGFWLLPGHERQVSVTVKKDETDGRWVEGVTVQSIWNNTLKE